MADLGKIRIKPYRLEVAGDYFHYPKLSAENKWLFIR